MHYGRPDLLINVFLAEYRAGLGAERVFFGLMGARAVKHPRKPRQALAERQGRIEGHMWGSLRPAAPNVGHISGSSGLGMCERLAVNRHSGRCSQHPGRWGHGATLEREMDGKGGNRPARTTWLGHEWGALTAGARAA
jgi:hypothetical protein